jgi:hypothetical protein
MVLVGDLKRKGNYLIMGCIKNKKSFLGIPYEGPHDYDIDYVHKFMSTSDDFIVSSSCKLCGCRQNENFVTWDELLNRGMTNEEIEEVCKNCWK